VEKPMAISFGECQEMIRACEKAAVPLFVAYYRRALPRFLKIKSLLQDGVIGKIRFVNVNFYQPPRENDVEGVKHWRVEPAIAGCGYFCDLASHMLDILQFLLGEITSAQGQVSNQQRLYEAEDMVSGLFSFNSAIHGAGIWNFNAYDNVDCTEIIGEKGKITFSTFGDSPVELHHQSSLQKFALKNPVHIQQPLIQTIVDELQGKGKCPSTGYSAAKTNWVMDQILSLILVLR
jgi:predicted dehydrogenase